MRKNCLGSDFYKQLASLLKAGLPLHSALQMLEARHKLGDLAEAISGGKSFSVALEDRGVPADIVSMVRVGEWNACLEENLFDISKHLEGQAKAKSSIKRTLTYPCIVLASSVLCIIGLLAFVLPMFASMFSGFDMPLPLLTRVLLSISQFWWLVLLAIAAFSAGAVLLYRKEQVKLGMPVVGRLHRYFICERFCAMLAQQLRNGVPILEAIRNIKPGISFKAYRDSIDSIYADLENGQKLSNCLARPEPCRRTVKLFPETLCQMIRVGEETGTLDSVLGEAADYYRQEAESAIKSVTGLIEPLSTLAVGGIVGLVAFAMLGPLFSVLDYLQ
ncbi:MAG: type II secretion system F family protein [Candidatus Margulisiibacteriota bacterium]